MTMNCMLLMMDTLNLAADCWYMMMLCCLAIVNQIMNVVAQLVALFANAIEMTWFSQLSITRLDFFSLNIPLFNTETRQQYWKIVLLKDKFVLYTLCLFTIQLAIGKRWKIELYNSCIQEMQYNSNNSKRLFHRTKHNNLTGTRAIWIQRIAKRM